VSKVYLVKDVERLEEALNVAGVEKFAGFEVPVKLHMGELGCSTYVSPRVAKIVVEKLKAVGARPFLLDSTVVYVSPRATVAGYKVVAKVHGFSEKSMGCPVKIDSRGVKVEVGGHEFEVIESIYKSQCILVLSHAKGHGLSGFGGAIKNLGMGGVTKKTKAFIHQGAKPAWDESRCTFCGACAAVCSFKAIKVEQNRWKLNKRKCFGCGKCVEACPSGALRYKVGNFQDMLALAAKACVQGKDVIYVNALVNITKYCDCYPRQQKPICPDIGYLVSRDAVAIDKASLDLINQIKPGLFEKLHKVDPYRQVRYGAKIGLGSEDYELVEL